MLLYRIFDAASILLELLSAAVGLYCILTWIAPRSSARYWLERFTDPICAPFRPLARMMIVRWGSPFDFTCLLAMIGISIMSRLLWVVYGVLVRLF